MRELVANCLKSSMNRATPQLAAAYLQAPCIARCSFAGGSNQESTDLFSEQEKLQKARRAERCTPNPL
jgi:hypothetical protein